LRSQSHCRLENIWTSPKTSNAQLGQDAAGGAQPNRVRRRSTHEALSVWWRNPTQQDSPAAVIGWNGVGKTWAVLDWLVEHKTEQPVILIVPSSALAGVSGVSGSMVKHFLADRMYELTEVRDPEHWLRRLNNLLKRPEDEGPTLVLFLDGLNQESSVSWLPLLKVLQGDSFAARVRAKLLEVGVGQLRQDIGVDFTRAKERLVLSEAETSQPTSDIHGRTPRARTDHPSGEAPCPGLCC